MGMNNPHVRDLEAEGFDTKIFGEAYYINSKPNADLAEQINRINRTLEQLTEAVGFLLKNRGQDAQK